MVETLATNLSDVCYGLYLLGNPSRVDDNIDRAESSRHVVDNFSDRFTIADINLVKVARDTGLLVELSSGLVAKFLVVIQDSDCLGADLSKGLCHVPSQPTGTTDAKMYISNQYLFSIIAEVLDIK